MATAVREVMTKSPVTLQAMTPMQEAARRMRDEDIGAVIVMKDGQLCGVVTDRDIAVRGVAEGHVPAGTAIGQICSQELVCVEPDASIAEAVELMRTKAVRRLPVVEGGQPVGIVSIGDLAVDRDSGSALADISAADPNH
jgi:signal-transduction protein with cAMP-binding, CBS, and nucleotidyltransferase domain